MRIGLVYTTKALATAREKKFWNAVKDIAPKGSGKYCDIIKHPTKNLWFVGVSLTGFYAMNTANDLTPLELISLKELSNDWFTDDPNSPL